jgi:hypothetical protein
MTSLMMYCLFWMKPISAGGTDGHSAVIDHRGLMSDSANLKVVRRVAALITGRPEDRGAAIMKDVLDLRADTEQGPTPLADLAYYIITDNLPQRHQAAPGRAREKPSRTVRFKTQPSYEQQLRSLAPGLTPRSVLDKMAAIQMVDVQLPTTDGRTVKLTHYTEPVADQAILLQRLKMSWPAQPPPRVTAAPAW